MNVKTTLASLLLLLLCLPVIAQDQPAPKPEAEKTKLRLKSGEEFEGTVKKTTEEGVSIDVGDNVVLFVRWAFVRGDKHMDLRKKATDYRKLDSVLRLADFCHDNAMDTEEAFVLATALGLDAGNKDLRERLAKLPQPDGLVVPPDPGAAPVPVPEPKVEPKPEVEKPAEPPPTRGKFKVSVEINPGDPAALTLFVEAFEKNDYKVVSIRDYEVLLRAKVTLTLIRNPTFLGAELYADYSGKLEYDLIKKGEKKAFASSSVDIEQLRGDTKAIALKETREKLVRDAFDKVHRELEKQR